MSLQAGTQLPCANVPRSCAHTAPVRLPVRKPHTRATHAPIQPFSTVGPSQHEAKLRGHRLATRAASQDTTATPQAASPAADGEVEVETRPGVYQGYWVWNGPWGKHRIRYQRSGDSGEAIVLIHGFGGNADHWRKNTGVLGQQHRVFAIDLLGYGFSDKPDPRSAPMNSIYNFTTWGQQIVDFIQEVVKEPSFVICNSVGGLAGLEAGIAREDLVRGIQLHDISLRGLVLRRLPSWQHPLLRAFQRLLRETALGRLFFSAIAQPQTVRNVLMEAYGDGRNEAVTDELIDVILKPGLQPGAVDVFLDFISFSEGPLPEELLTAIASKSVPVSMLWGEKDPWENIDLGRKLFADIPSVKEFIPLPGVGHCPMDEAPEIVNDQMLKFVAKFSMYDDL